LWRKDEQKRTIYLFAALFLFLIEILMALFIHDDFVRPYIGDVIIVLLIYCIVRAIFPDKIMLLSAYVFLFACFTEFMQYLHIIELLGLQNNTFFRIILGTVFDWSDILSYGIGCALLSIHDMYENFMS